MPARIGFGVLLAGEEGVVESFKIVEKAPAAGRRQRPEDFFDAGLVAGRNFAPEGAAFRGEEEDGLAAVAGMFLAFDECVADHAVEDDGDAGFADEEEIDEVGLVHPALAIGEEVEDVELGAGEAEGQEVGFAAAFEEVLHEEEGDEEIVGFGLALHGVIFTLNCMMSNHIWRIFGARPGRSPARERRI